MGYFEPAGDHSPAFLLYIVVGFVKLFNTFTRTNSINNSFTFMKNKIIAGLIGSGGTIALIWCILHTVTPNGPQTSEKPPYHVIIYNLSIKYQNGDSEIKYVTDPSCRWVPNSMCIEVGDERICGVRHFHFINPAPAMK